MAFFGFGKKKKKDTLTSQPKAGHSEHKDDKASERVASKAKEAEAPSRPAKRSSQEQILSAASDAISAPRVTEKATDLTQYENAYVFNVLPGATKQEIAAAVAERYGVTPVKVRTLPIPHKRRFSRGKWAIVGGGKKAVVYLKKGDTIQIS